MSGLLMVAIDIATKAHWKQRDSAGQPYLLHALRVMHGVGTRDQERAAIAVLHDVREDHPEYWHTILNSMTVRVVTGLELLCHDPAVEYPAYITKLLVNDDARITKKYDLMDNMDSTRFHGTIPDKWARKLPKYALALKAIEEYQP